MPLHNPSVVVSDLPTGAVAQTYSRRQQMSTASTPTSGRLTMSAVYLSAGQTVTSVTFASTATALQTGTHGWAALYDPSLALLGQSVNDTSIVWAAATAKTFTLAAPVTVSVSGWFYVGVCVVASTMPTLSAIVPNPATALFPPVMGGTSTSTLTSTAPNPAAAISASVPYIIYAYVS